MNDSTHHRFDLKAEILKKLELCVWKFRDRPPQKYLEAVADEMSRRMKLVEVDRYLSGIEDRYKRFPTMFDINKDIKGIERKHWHRADSSDAVVVKPKEWLSRQAPGTPAKAEALFELIKKNDTESGPFRMARAMYSHLTDDEVWEAYNDWHHGRVSQIIFKGGE